MTLHEKKEIQRLKETTDSLLAFCTSEGRVCPVPQKWSRFWIKFFEKESRVCSMQNPPRPLILATWNCDDETKRQSLAAEILLAEKLGILEEVSSYLRSLNETDWYRE